MLVAAMNPCRCGYYPDRNRCSCTEHDIKRYMSRVSKPIWDRIDICTHMGMIDARDILYESDADKSSDFYTTANMKKCVKTAYDIQKERFSNENIEFNSQMNEKHVKNTAGWDRQKSGLWKLHLKDLILRFEGIIRC